MQKETALSFITKLQVIATLLMNYLIFFGLVKLVSFKKVIAFMQSVPIKKNSIIDPTTIYLYERKIARKLKISQGLTLVIFLMRLVQLSMVTLLIKK